MIPLHLWTHDAPTVGDRTMSGWQELKAEKNRRSLVRLTKALPPIFPRVVLARGLARPFVPPTPRLAIESYWGAHPIRADRLARALAARSRAPDGWRKAEPAFGPEFWCVCGQPVHRLVGTLTFGVAVPTERGLA